MTEIWKTIPGYEGRYEVSDQGHLRSIGFYVAARAGGRRWAAPKVLKPTVKKCSGHLFVTIDRKRLYVHTAVLITFVGPRPYLGTEGCHGDGNTNNNTLANLRWDTRLANVADCIGHGKFYEGDRHYMAKLTAEKVRSARNQYVEGCSGIDLAKFYGVAIVTMYDALKGKTWARA